MSNELLIGLAGGAIGAVLAAAFAQAGRAWTAFGEVTLHDEEAAERNRRLVTWADDRTRVVIIEMDRRTQDLSGRGLLYSGIHGAAVAEAKADALHEYRDQEEQAKIDLARLRAKEAAWHFVWRRLRGRPAPSLTAREQVEPFLERWREPVTRHGSGAGDSVTPLDRTTRTRDDALAELPDLKLN